MSVDTNFIHRVTFSNYPNLGYRVNYFNISLILVLTKQKDCGKIRSVVSNSYSLGVF